METYIDQDGKDVHTIYIPSFTRGRMNVYTLNHSLNKRKTSWKYHLAYWEDPRTNSEYGESVDMYNFERCNVCKQLIISGRFLHREYSDTIYYNTNTGFEITYTLFYSQTSSKKQYKWD